MRWVQINGELVPADEATAQHESKGPAVHIFKAGFYEHIDSEPIYIGSRKQLQNETRSRGLTSDYAE
jgi:hypothetical protein